MRSTLIFCLVVLMDGFNPEWMKITTEGISNWCILGGAFIITFLWDLTDWFHK